MIKMLEARQIEFAVKSRLKPIISKTNLSVLKGEFLIILGHNGSGKSSLIKIMSGDKKPTFGKIFINGKNLIDIDRKTKARDLITITQDSHDRLFLKLTLKENIILWESRFAKQSFFSAKNNEIIHYLPQHFTNMLDNKVSILSGGEKQAFLLALALAYPPKLLFLDEHTSALDPKSAVKIMDKTNKTIKENKITTIMVTHKLEDAVNYGNRIIVMNEGVMTHDFQKTAEISVDYLKKII